MPARSLSLAGASIPAKTRSPPRFARRTRKSCSIPHAVDVIGAHRPLPDRHRLCRHAGHRRHSARPSARLRTSMRSPTGSRRRLAFCSTRQPASPKRPVPGPRAPLLRDHLERTQDLGGNRGDDRQPLAQAPVALKHRCRQMAPPPRNGAAARRARRRRRTDALCRRRRPRRPARPPGERRRPRDASRARRSVQRLEAARIKAVPTGIDHGTITAVSDGHPYEVTTLRRDVSTDGRRATVAFTTAWEEDAARRDFTINALSADPRTGEVFDYFGGLDDLWQRHVRFIGDPLEAHRRGSSADPSLLPLPCAVRHRRARPAALDACTARANDLMALSRERIADELLKLLALADPSTTVAIMLERGILKPVLPEIARGTARGPEVADRRRADGRDRARRASAGSRRCCRATRPSPETSRARLKLSNKARKRLACAAGADSSVGARRRLPIASAPIARSTGCCSPASRAKPREIAKWHAPRLPIGGGALIARGLPKDRSSRARCRRSRIAGSRPAFPRETSLEAIVADALAAAANAGLARCQREACDGAAPFRRAAAPSGP